MSHEQNDYEGFDHSTDTFIIAFQIINDSRLGSLTNALMSTEAFEQLRMI